MTDPDLTSEIRKEVDKTVGWVTESLSTEDPLGVVIRGHLYVESRLIQLIEEALVDPGAIDLTRLNFPVKLDLAVALGLLSENDKRGYAALNALRNRVAHKADIEIVDTDERQVHKALTAEQRSLGEAYIGHFSGKPFPTLRASIVALVIHNLTLFAAEKAKKAFVKKRAAVDRPLEP